MLRWNRRFLCIAWAIAWVLPVTHSLAAEIISPDAIPGSTKVDAEGVINIVNTVSDLVIVDARITEDRKQGFIEGSVSLPDIVTNCDTLSKVIHKKSQPVLFYCNGVKCGRSVKSVKTAMQCGYDKIYWFRGGFEEWKAKGYPFVSD
jgi:rhodanese-related sulfurtransferase